MAPSGRTITAEATATTSTKTATRTKKTTRRTRRVRHPRTHFKKQNQQQNKVNKIQEMATGSSQDSSKEGDIMDTPEVIDHVSNSACSTPKGQKFRIPEISTCPPAPKKPRVLSNCSLRRSPLSFFAPPDLELFFFMALRDVSV